MLEVVEVTIEVASEIIWRGRARWQFFISPEYQIYLSSIGTVQGGF